MHLMFSPLPGGVCLSQRQVLMKKLCQTVTHRRHAYGPRTPLDLTSLSSAVLDFLTPRPQLSLSARAFQELLCVVIRVRVRQTDTQMPPEARWKIPEMWDYAKLFTYADKSDLGCNRAQLKTQVLRVWSQTDQACWCMCVCVHAPYVVCKCL